MTSPGSLSDIFSIRAVLPDLVGRSKHEVLEEMVACAVSTGALPRARKAQAVTALDEREERGSTALGRGIAIPHAKIAGLRRHAGLVARSSEGVDFRSIDGEPVHVLVMLVSPESRLEEHLGLLRWISRVARDGDFVSFIRQARTAQEILDVLHERAG
jgi:mannitol/fructose-specific phosphotransferase system IIA component (Ntr-type)